MVQISIN